MMTLAEQDPIKLLIVPGIDGSGARHWQTEWERDLEDCYRVELGCWDDPIRNVWISRLDQAVHEAGGDVVLVAHSLGCQAVAWWARLLGASAVPSVRGALLVAPPDVDQQDVDRRLDRFAPNPDVAFAFPALVVASRDDPYATIDRSREIADQRGAAFLDAGDLGHINADSDIAEWEEGQALLPLLIGGTRDRNQLSRLAADLLAKHRHGSKRIPSHAVRGRGRARVPLPPAAMFFDDGVVRGARSFGIDTGD
ncbi:RBBP9/YdeN family alpha/beta hydrolase [Sphingomonas azotifigens]|uniref:RBBP9/YdeN family alpha/beta hydrolase n=1 Tax=Sphingomonas azotifigens TaxID=330920 RepID=UPI001FE8863E|nr:alpha/beta hydrolase [Sphingomonas azotifigens]